MCLVLRLLYIYIYIDSSARRPNHAESDKTAEFENAVALTIAFTIAVCCSVGGAREAHAGQGRARQSSAKQRAAAHNRAKQDGAEQDNIRTFLSNYHGLLTIPAQTIQNTISF